MLVPQISSQGRLSKRHKGLPILSTQVIIQDGLISMHLAMATVRPELEWPFYQNLVICELYANNRQHQSSAW